MVANRRSYNTQENKMKIFDVYLILLRRRRRSHPTRAVLPPRIGTSVKCAMR